jgi:hypothetical protein
MSTAPLPRSAAVEIQGTLFKELCVHGVFAMRFQLSACAIAVTALLAGCNLPGGSINVEQTETGFIIEFVCPTLDDGEDTPDGTPDETPDLEPDTDEEVDGEIPAATDG